MTDDSRHGTTIDWSPGTPGETEAGVRLRLLTSHDDFVACVALQLETWGAESADIVPASLMQAATRVGGLAVGAIADDGTLVGFVFGLSGFRNGDTVHWSHMLAVHRAARCAGIGRRLKECQSAELACRGIASVFWTFDPLQVRNAHLNLNRLGVRVLEYVVDMYGASPSPLHYGLATDRLIVMRRTSDASGASGARAPRPDAGTSIHETPILTPFPRPGDRLVDAESAAALIEIPSNLDEEFSRSPGAPAEWRVATRTHFQWAMRQGLSITALLRDPMTGRAFYVVGHDSRDTQGAGEAPA
jgi:predicted GNAT superfamily acetyltransferase